MRKEKHFGRYNKNVPFQLVLLHRHALNSHCLQIQILLISTHVNLLFSDVQEHIKSKRATRNDHNYKIHLRGATIIHPACAVDFRLKSTDCLVYYTHITWHCTCVLRSLLIPTMLKPQLDVWTYVILVITFLLQWWRNKTRQILCYKIA